MTPTPQARSPEFEPEGSSPRVRSRFRTAALRGAALHHPNLAFPPHNRQKDKTGCEREAFPSAAKNNQPKSTSLDDRLRYGKAVSSPEITTYCCFCERLRPGQHGLSSVEMQPDGSLRRVGHRQCRRCVTTDPEDDVC